MVYHEQFVVVVKVNGKILREHDGTVTLPFGSEYSILVKNLNSKRAVVNISIDGQDVLNGKQLIVEPSTEFPLEGFLDGFRVKNKFKFIQKTKEVIEHRGDRIDDGIIRVEYQFEKEVETRKVIHEVHEYRWNYHQGCSYYCPYPWYPSTPCNFYSVPGIWYSVSDHSFSPGSKGFSAGDVSSYSANAEGKAEKASFSVENLSSVPRQDEGITVPGSYSDQTFVPSWIGNLEENSRVIILRLRGTTSSGEVVSKPLTVKTRLICPSCGKKSKSYSKFCSRCGTSLSI